MSEVFRALFLNLGVVYELKFNVQYVFLTKNNYNIIYILCCVQCTVLLLLIIYKKQYSMRVYKNNIPSAKSNQRIVVAHLRQINSQS